MHVKAQVDLAQRTFAEAALHNILVNSTEVLLLL